MSKSELALQSKVESVSWEELVVKSGCGVVLKDVSKGFAGDSGYLRVLERLSLNLNPGEFVSILGPSGAGKTTLLRLIAGLDRPDSGKIKFFDSGSREVEPSRLRIGVVFQEPRLLPWATAATNIRYGLQDRARYMSDSDQRAAVSSLIERLGLKGFESYYPHQISGGMAQRVGLARALIGEPDLLIMDEPLGSLDVKNRFIVQDLLSETIDGRESESLTCVMVTHSIDEALYLSDRVCVLSGRPASVSAEVEVTAQRPRDRVRMNAGDTRRQLIEALDAMPSKP